MSIILWKKFVSEFYGHKFLENGDFCFVLFTLEPGSVATVKERAHTLESEILDLNPVPPHTYLHHRLLIRIMWAKYMKALYTHSNYITHTSFRGCTWLASHSFFPEILRWNSCMSSVSILNIYIPIQFIQQRHDFPEITCSPGRQEQYWELTLSSAIYWGGKQITCGL